MARKEQRAVSSEFAPEPSATVTPMKALVVELLADLEAIRAKIPRFQHPHPKTRKLVRTFRSVPREFVQQMNDSVKFSDELQAFKTYDPEEGAAALDFVDNFRVFSSQLSSFLQAVNFTMEVRFAEVAEKGLRTYQIAKAFRRAPRTSVGPHLTRMRDALNRAGRKKRKKKADTSS
jgi:hypothetical protein